MKLFKSVIITIFITGMVVFAFLDLDISKKLYHPNTFGFFFAKYGEVPGYFLIVASLTTLLTKNKRIIVLVSLLVSFLWTDPIVTLFSLISSLIVAYGQDQLKAAKKSLAVAAIHPLLIVQIIKLFWGRVRFRDLTSDDSFTPWYSPQGITGNYSFPSGHTSMGIYLLCVMYFRPRDTTFVSLALLWAILVGLSRILVGAHYPSDVWFSFFTGLLIILYIDTLDEEHHS